MMRIMFGLTQRSQVLLSSSSLALRLRLRTPLQLHITSLFSTAPSSPPTLDDGKHEGQRVSVWWNIDNRATPTPTLTAISLSNIVQSITEAVTRTIGINIQGPLEINAFGHIPCFTQQALTAAGVNFIGLENGADRSLVDRVSQNPPSAHMFLLCSDTTFAGIMDKLRTSDKNILLASRESEQTLDNLYRPASIIWHWSELVNGEILSGKHFEVLPGRYFSSWYLIYKGLSEDPLTMTEQIKDEDSLILQSFYYRHRPVPEVLVRQLMNILFCFPGGLTISELRNELEVRNVPIDKVFYGYKKFLHLLLALPHTVDVQSHPDGQFIVRDASVVIKESLLRKKGFKVSDPVTALSKRQSEESSNESLDYEHRRVPVAILNQVIIIADRYREGVSITEFHNQLERSCVAVDEAYYGYGTLSHFLSALPLLVEVKSHGDGEIFVYPATIMVSATRYPLMTLHKHPPPIDLFPQGTSWVDNGSLQITKWEPLSPERLLEYQNLVSDDEYNSEDEVAELMAQEDIDMSH